MVNKQQVLNGWLKFAEAEMARSRTDLAGKWGIPFFAGLMFETEWKKLIEPNIDLIRSLGYMDESCNIDIDRLHSELSGIAKRMGRVIQGFPVFGEYAFTDQDVDKLYQYIVTS